MKQLSIYDKIAAMKIEPPSHWTDPPEMSYWGERVFAEIATVLEISKGKDHAYDALAGEAVDLLYDNFVKTHAIPDELCRKAEEILLPAAGDAKSCTIHCVAHAHLDMDWMWGYHETAAIVTGTFRTMLNLMEEYPDFIFSQSQAAAYDLVKRYDPDMFEEIRARVKEGRWEFAGSAWVELDKNLPSGESMARHILYTKRFLHEEFDLPYESINNDFHPDSFGHSGSIPEIFREGGIQYFYHCRGLDGPFLYRWQSESGAEVITCNEPLWYNDSIRPIYLSLVPKFCRDYGVHDFMKIYGVGDHGGGPTRKDIERILDMQTWPVAPTIRFSTYHAFFEAIAPYKENFPVIKGELGPTFTGCYTSESRIKSANRIVEDHLSQSEAVNALAAIDAGNKRYRGYREAWQKVLFNHFHDILPGSGVQESKDHARGYFEEAMASADSAAVIALDRFAAKIDTSGFETPDEALLSRSEGGGVGCIVDEAHHYRFPATERGRGRTRIVHLFNPTNYDRESTEEVTLWDWYGNPDCMTVTDQDGNAAPFEHLGTQSGAWNHLCTNILIRAKIPAYGYSTYVISEKPRESFRFAYFPPDPRVIYYPDMVLENRYLRAEFSPTTMELTRLTDKETGEVLICKPSAYFVLASENSAYRGGSAWVEGDYTHLVNINEAYKPVLQNAVKTSGLRKQFTYCVEYERSRLECTVSLDDASRALRFDVKADWREYGKSGGTIPVLRFEVPLSYAVEKCRGEIQFGTVDRDQQSRHDSFSRRFYSAIPANGKQQHAATLLTDTKYGYRCADNTLQVNLLRSTHGPNKYPEMGQRYVRIGIGVGESSGSALYRMADEFTVPALYITNTAHTGTLPLGKQYIKANAGTVIANIKLAEDDGSLILRTFAEERADTEAVITFAKPVKSACLTDINEQPRGEVTIRGNTVSYPIGAGCMKTLKVTL